MIDFVRSLTLTLVENLFHPEDKNFQQQIKNLTTENNALLGKAHDGFNHLGVPFWMTSSVVPSQLPPLAPTLHEQMTQLLRFHRVVSLDRNLTQQVLFKIVHPCETIQDWRDALPDYLVALDNYVYSEYSRTRDPLFTVQHDARTLRQYEKLRPKIETYAAMRFLY